MLLVYNLVKYPAVLAREFSPMKAKMPFIGSCVNMSINRARYLVR